MLLGMGPPHASLKALDRGRIEQRWRKRLEDETLQMFDRKISRDDCRHICWTVVLFHECLRVGERQPIQTFVRADDGSRVWMRLRISRLRERLPHGPTDGGFTSLPKLAAHDFAFGVEGRLVDARQRIAHATGFENQEVEGRVARAEFVVSGAIVIGLSIGNTRTRLLQETRHRSIASFGAKGQVLDQVSQPFLATRIGGRARAYDIDDAHDRGSSVVLGDKSETALEAKITEAKRGGGCIWRLARRCAAHRKEEAEQGEHPFPRAEIRAVSL